MKGYIFVRCNYRWYSVSRITLLSFFFRFWKIADTFTGLKLKGLVGHFGRFTATDIEGFVELPDGKVSAAYRLGLHAHL